MGHAGQHRFEQLRVGLRVVRQQQTMEKQPDLENRSPVDGGSSVKPHRSTVSLNAKAFWTVAAWLLLLCAHPAGAQIQDIHRISDGTFDSHVQYRRFDIPKGKAVEIANLEGPAKITYFYITDDGLPKFHPGLVLKVFWDDAKEPSINVPLADFFGAFERKAIDYQSRLLSINHHCYMSYLPMPFSKRARFLLANDGDEDYSRVIAYGIDYEKGTMFAGEKSRLHCAWRRSNPTKDSVHTLLEARGRGHYIGNFLYVHSRYAGWWGEGDTVFTVNGKAITHTPGTEDEYGSAWGFEHTFSYLDTGYLQMDNGRHRMYRWYAANPVRFQSSLKVQIQNQRWAEGSQIPSRDDYTSVVFWYQDQPQSVTLAPFAARTAPSQAVEYAKKP